MSGTAVGEVLISEEVWGAPLRALAREHPVARRPGAWEDRSLLRELVRDARALVVRNRTQVDEDLLAHAPALEVIGRAGVGLDNVDVAAADAAGVVVVVPLGANATSVAEHTLALALALARDLTERDAVVRAGGWPRTPARELRGRTWGLLGAGATGRAVAALAAAFGMRVLACDPQLDPAAAHQAGIEPVAFDALLAGADVLSIHVPATAETIGLVGERELACLRPGCLLVNVGRGEVVDEAALAAALHSGHLGGAGLDVRAEEPPKPGPLDSAPHVIFTPHIAGITTESQERIMTILATDIAAVLAGGQAEHAIGQHRVHTPRRPS